MNNSIACDKLNIPVTKTFFPEEELYQSYVKQIWESGWITNHGKLQKALKQKLELKLGVKDMILTANGTFPIQSALKSLPSGAEIITTPFSYIATSSAIVWEGLIPIFVDIDPLHLTIDEEKISAAINNKTKAILATHVFGNPCNIERIQQIANDHDLMVIYDAAHCFGVKYNGQSIFKSGDISTCSFHATKLFHTVEGGAIFCNQPSMLNEMNYMGNFGHDGQYAYHGVGVNSKMSELHAAMGLSVLPSIDNIILNRKRAVARYKELLPLEILQLQKIRDNTEWNYSYLPIMFPSESALINCLENLKQWDIFPRRYFYPSLNVLSFLGNQKMPVSESIAARILCLPLYYGLEDSAIDHICGIICELDLQT